MSTNFPADIYKVENEDQLYGDKIKYHFVLSSENKGWSQTSICSLQQLTDLRAKIDRVLNEASLAEKLKISEKEARFFEKQFETDNICKSCDYKRSENCKTCLLVLDSPLERKLFVELSKANVYFQPQYPLNQDGKKASMSGANWFDDLLTKVDFYIPYKEKVVCLYADGHTYHERTEEQATRDKKIDRRLQELGYQVLRYTGREIRENTAKIIEDVKRWIN